VPAWESVKRLPLLDSRRNTKLLTLSNVNITAKQQQTIPQGDINQPSKIISMSLHFTIMAIVF
jgi:hypothetical protein